MNRPLALLLTVMMLCSCAAPVAAIPSGPVIVAGSVVTISGLGTNETVVVVGAPGGGSRAAINWASLDIDNTNPQQSLIFKDGTGNGNFAVLNRVVSGAPTNIYGIIKTRNSSNVDAQVGQVFIVNPNGININDGARINCGAITLSSLDTSADTFINRPNKPIVFSTSSGGVTSGDIKFMNNSSTEAQNYIAVLGAGYINAATDNGARTILTSPVAGTLLFAQAKSVALSVADPTTISYSGVTSCTYANHSYIATDAAANFKTVMQANKIINIIDNTSANALATMRIGVVGSATSDSKLACNSFELYYGNPNSSVDFYKLSNADAALTQFRYIGTTDMSKITLYNPALANSFGFGVVSAGGFTINQTMLATLQTNCDSAKTKFGLAMDVTDSGYRALVAKSGDINQSLVASDCISGDEWSFEAQGTLASQGTNAKIVLMNKSNSLTKVAFNGAAAGAGLFTTASLTVGNSWITGTNDTGSAVDYGSCPGLYFTTKASISQSGSIYAPYLYVVSDYGYSAVTLNNAYNTVFDTHNNPTSQNTRSLDATFCTASYGGATLSFNSAVCSDAVNVRSAGRINTAIIAADGRVTVQAPTINVTNNITSNNSRITLWNNNNPCAITLQGAGMLTSNDNDGSGIAAIVINTGIGGSLTTDSSPHISIPHYSHGSITAPYLAINTPDNGHSATIFVQDATRFVPGDPVSLITFNSYINKDYNHNSWAFYNWVNCLTL